MSLFSPTQRHTMRPLTRLRGLVTISLALFMTSSVYGDPITAAERAYQEALQYCEQLSDEAQRQNCRQDAAAALSEARKNPDKYQQIDEQTLLQNRLSRCDALPPEQRALCIQSLQDGIEEDIETETSGSVEGGGLLRKTTITEHGTPYTIPASELPADYEQSPHRITIKEVITETIPDVMQSIEAGSANQATKQRPATGVQPTDSTQQPSAQPQAQPESTATPADTQPHYGAHPVRLD